MGNWPTLRWVLESFVSGMGDAEKSTRNPEKKGKDRNACSSKKFAKGRE